MRKKESLLAAAGLMLLTTALQSQPVSLVEDGRDRTGDVEQQDPHESMRAGEEARSVASDEIMNLITVRLYDYVGIEDPLLTRSKQVATDLLAEAGVFLKWEQFRAKSPTEANDEPRGRRSDETVLQVRIHPERDAKRLHLLPWQFGYAVPPPKGFGVIAGVFLERVHQLASSRRQDTHFFLGHVLAHELGHLLMGSRSHAGTGIMRRRWNEADLQKAVRGNLGFSPVQGRLMRRRTLDRVIAANRARPTNWRGTERPLYQLGQRAISPAATAPFRVTPSGSPPRGLQAASSAQKVTADE